MRGLAPLLIIAIAAGLLALSAAGFSGYTQYARLAGDLASTTAQRSDLARQLDQARADNEELSQRLADEVAKNSGFETQIGDIASTVGTLTKLSQTDHELLEKYSRVYFLNENYVPQALATITPEYTLEPTRVYRFHAEALPFLLRMLDAAKEDGAPVLVMSAYRSYGEQINLKISYTTVYGAGANRFSADQGYSEHQLGTAADLTTKQLAGTSLAFASTSAGVWLRQNAYKYGFVLSYPKGNAYYQYEPWHWRFVGVSLATRLHQDGEDFYALPQRDIDPYLVSIFDTPSSLPN